MSCGCGLPGTILSCLCDISGLWSGYIGIGRVREGHAGRKGGREFTP